MADRVRRARHIARIVTSMTEQEYSLLRREYQYSRFMIKFQRVLDSDQVIFSMNYATSDELLGCLPILKSALDGIMSPTRLLNADFEFMA